MSTFQETRPKLEIYRTPDQLKRHTECINMNGKTGDKEILNQMKQNNDQIQERRKKINELQNKTNQMCQSSFSYLDNCKKLSRKLKGGSSSTIGMSSNEDREGKEGGHPIIASKEENPKIKLLNFQSEITQKNLRIEGDTEAQKSNKCFSHYENDIFSPEKKHTQIKEIENSSSSERGKNKKKKKAFWLAWCC